MKYEISCEKTAVDKLIDVVSNSYTSRGRYNVIFEGEFYRGYLITKDGKNSIEQLQDCKELRATAVFRKAYEVAATAEKEAGDGTSTAVLAFLKAFDIGITSGYDVSPSAIAAFRKLFIKYFEGKALPLIDNKNTEDKFVNIKKFIKTSCGSSLSNRELDIVINEVISSVENNNVFPQIMETPFKEAEENVSVQQKHGTTFNIKLDPLFHLVENKQLDYCYYAFCTRLTADVMDYAKAAMKTLWHDNKVNSFSRLFIFYQDIDEDIAYLLRDRNKYISADYSTIVPLQFLNTTRKEFDEITDALGFKYAIDSLDIVSEAFKIIKNIDNIGYDLLFFMRYHEVLLKYAGIEDTKSRFVEEHERVRFIPNDSQNNEHKEDTTVDNKTNKKPKKDEVNAVKELAKALDTRVVKTKEINKVATLLALLEDIRTAPKKYATIEARNDARNTAVLAAVPKLITIIQSVRRRAFVGGTTFAKFGQGFNTLSLGFSHEHIMCDKDYLNSKLQEAINRHAVAKDERERILSLILIAIYADTSIKVIKCYGRDIYDSLEDTFSALGLIVAKGYTDKAFVDGSFRRIRKFIQQAVHGAEDTKGIFVAVLKELSSIFASKYYDAGGKINPGSPAFCSCLSPSCEGCTLDSLLSVMQMLDAMCEGIKFSKSLIINTSKF